MVTLIRSKQATPACSRMHGAPVVYRLHWALLGHLEVCTLTVRLLSCCRDLDSATHQAPTQGTVSRFRCDIVACFD